MKNFSLKLFSVLVALLLFQFVRSESNTSTAEVTLPIEITNVPKEMVIIAPKERDTRVSIKGPTSFVSRIVASPPVVRIALPQGVSTRYLVSLRSVKMPIPSYVQIQRIEPSELELTLDKLVSKEVSVSVPTIKGEGAKTIELEISPDKVTISGPLTELRLVSRVETYPLDLREIGDEFERDLPIQFPGGTLFGRSLEISPSFVHVKARSGAPDLAP